MAEDRSSTVLSVLVRQLASCALDSSTRSQRLVLLEQALEAVRDDHGMALANETGMCVLGFYV